MPEDAQQPIDLKQIREMLKEKKGRMKVCLSACAGCTLCAESCFRFKNHDGDPRYMPSYKVLNSLGLLYKKKGKVSRAQLEQMKELVWGNCALCERCYCPFGIDLPNMIAFARSILRSQGIDGAYPDSPAAPEQDDRQDATEEDSSESE
jgi:succinate dehydrogenase/fumarate reductase-like Fe-S protein